MWSVSSVSVTCVIVLAAGLYDIAWRRIPNILPVCLVLVGVVNHLFDRHLGLSATLATSVFALCFIAWMFGILGGGDVKLLAAAAFSVPPIRVADLILLTALAGGVLSLCYILMSRLLPRVSPVRPASRLRRILRTEQRRIVRRLSLPYGVAIACGSILVMTIR